MFRELRRLPDLIEHLAVSIGDVAGLLQRHLNELSEETRFRDRLEELEMSRARWEAEIEAALVKVESRYKAASSSEARERALRRSNAGSDGSNFASEEDIVEAYRALGFVPQGDGEGGQEDGVLALREDVADPGEVSPGKILALKAKFGD